MEAEQLGALLRDKESEIDRCQKEIEVLKKENAQFVDQINEVRCQSCAENLWPFDPLT